MATSRLINFITDCDIEPSTVVYYVIHTLHDYNIRNVAVLRTLHNCLEVAVGLIGDRGSYTHYKLFYEESSSLSVLQTTICHENTHEK